MARTRKDYGTEVLGGRMKERMSCGDQLRAALRVERVVLVRRGGNMTRRRRILVCSTCIKRL